MSRSIMKYIIKNKVSRNTLFEEETYKEIAVVIAFLTTYTDLNFIVTCFPRSFEEVLWEALSLFVEIVPRSLL